MAKKAAADDCTLADCNEAIKTLDTDIEYLEESIPRYPKDAKIRKHLVDRYNKLIRARNWFFEEFTRTHKK